MPGLEGTGLDPLLWHSPCCGNAHDGSGHCPGRGLTWGSAVMALLESLTYSHTGPGWLYPKELLASLCAKFPQIMPRPLSVSQITNLGLSISKDNFIPGLHYSYLVMSFRQVTLINLKKSRDKYLSLSSQTVKAPYSNWYFIRNKF